MSIRRLALAGVAASIVAAGIVGAAAPASAAAADPSNVNVNCDITGNVATVTGAVGDTFTVTNSGVRLLCTSITGDAVAPSPGSIAIGNYKTLTIVQAGTVSVNYGDFLPTVVGTITVVISEPSPSSEVSPTGPVALLQQLPMPASGECSDVDPKHALWAQGVTTPWTMNWAEWSEPLFSGWVCERWINSDGSAAS